MADSPASTELTRRGFVAGSTIAACACLTGAASLVAAAPGPAGTVDVGAVSDYPADAISDRFAKSHKLLVIRHADKLYATSAICTHKSCTLKLKDNTIACPCHSSKFSNEGVPTGGPAKRSLSRYAIRITDSQRVLVDTARSFAQAKWDDPASFVKVS